MDSNVSKLSITALLLVTLSFGALLVWKFLSMNTMLLVDNFTVVALALYTITGVLALLRVRFVKVLIMIIPLSSFALCTISGSTFFIALALMLLSSGFILMLCQIKKNGVAYWNVIMGNPTDTTTLTDRIAEYFIKNTNGGVDSNDRIKLVVGNMVVSIVVVAILVLLIYAWGQVSFNIQWNMFKSTLMPLFYIIGLFITIFNPVPKFTSWLVYKDKDGDEIGREKDDDITEFMFNTFFLPLLMRFLIFPVIGAAYVYYPLICILAIVETIIPILFLVIIALVIPIYIICSKNILNLKHKNSGLLFTPVLTILIVGTISLIWLQTTENKVSGYFTNIDGTAILHSHSNDYDSNIAGDDSNIDGDDSNIDGDDKFDNFIKKFVEDYEFQLTRIKFPVGYSVLILEDGTEDKTEMNKSSWNQYSFSDFITQHGSLKHDDKNNYTYKWESDGGACWGSATFSLIGNQWYLTEYSSACLEI